MDLNILITGGTGFIGSHLIEYFLKQQYNIIVLSRKIKKNANNLKYILNLDSIKDNTKIDIIINLAGAPIDKNWTKKYKKILLNSRIQTTKKIISLIERLDNKPKVLISGSAVGYYGARDTKSESDFLDENSNYKPCFTHTLCEKWENEANLATKFGTRVCIIRLGVVLGKDGGMLKKIFLPFKLGLGGNLGDGKQYLSWVHIDDVIRVINYLIINNSSSGVYNLTSPNPISNSYFTKHLGKTLKRLTLFTMPSFVIQLLFGEMGEELLLGSNKVIPSKLLEEGYKFKYPKIEEALEDIYKK